MLPIAASRCLFESLAVSWRSQAELLRRCEALRLADCPELEMLVVLWSVARELVSLERRGWQIERVRRRQSAQSADQVRPVRPFRSVPPLHLGTHRDTPGIVDAPSLR